MFGWLRRSNDRAARGADADALEIYKLSEKRTG